MPNRKGSEFVIKTEIKRFDKVEGLDSEATPGTANANISVFVKDLHRKEVINTDVNVVVAENQGNVFFNSTKSSGTHVFTLQSYSLNIGETIQIKKTGLCDSVDVVEGSSVTIYSPQSATEIGDILIISKMDVGIFSCVKISEVSNFSLGNGLTDNDGTAELGGTLTKHTSIFLDDKTLGFQKQESLSSATSTILTINPEFIELKYLDTVDAIKRKEIRIDEHETIFRDDFHLTGLQYHADYSVEGSVNPRWIPDFQAVKDYVDNSTSGSVTASNGLTKTDDDISLGGILVENTTIDGDENDFFISNTNNFGLDANIISLTGGSGSNSIVLDGIGISIIESISTNSLIIEEGGIGIYDNYNSNLLTFDPTGIIIETNDVTDTKSINLLSGTNDFGIVVTDTNGVGLVNVSDYTSKQLLNDRAITDVGGVKILIDDKASTTYVDAQDKLVLKSLFITDFTHVGSSIYEGTSGYGLTGSDYHLDFPATIMFRIMTIAALGSNLSFKIDSLPPIYVRDENGEAIIFLNTGQTYTAYKFGVEYRVKGANSEGLVISVTTSDVGATYTSEPSRLTSMPRVFILKIVNTALYTDASTINIGFGAKLLKDANGDAIGNDNAIQDRFYNCYYDDLTDTIRVLNFTNVNAIQAANISGNDYIVAKVFNRFPQELSVRWSATNPTATPRIEISNGLALPVMRDIVDQFGFALNPNVFEVGRIYILRWNSSTNKFEVQGVSSTLPTGSYWSKQVFNSLFEFLPVLISSGSISEVSLGTGSIFTHLLMLKSSATANSGARTNYNGNKALIPNMMREYIFYIPSVACTTRKAIFGLLHENYLPASATLGVWFEVNNLTLSCKCVDTFTTTHATTYTLSLNTVYKAFIEVNDSLTSINFKLFVYGNSTAVLNVDITTNIPTSATLVELMEGIASEAAIKDIIGFHSFGVGDVEGYKRLG